MYNLRWGRTGKIWLDRCNLYPSSRYISVCVQTLGRLWRNQRVIPLQLALRYTSLLRWLETMSLLKCRGQEQNSFMSTCLENLVMSKFLSCPGNARDLTKNQGMWKKIILAAASCLNNVGGARNLQISDRGDCVLKITFLSLNFPKMGG